MRARSTKGSARNAGTTRNGERCLRRSLLVMWTYPLARKGAYASASVTGAILDCNLLHRKVLMSHYQQRMAQAPQSRRLRRFGRLLLFQQRSPCGPELTHPLGYRSSLRGCQTRLPAAALGRGLSLRSILSAWRIRPSSPQSMASPRPRWRGRRFSTVAGAISMPNISERSSLASTFRAGGSLTLFRQIGSGLRDQVLLIDLAEREE